MAQTMQAAEYYGPEDLRVEEHPLPEIGPGEANAAFAAAADRKAFKIVLDPGR